MITDDYTCDQINDVGGEDEPVGRCHEPAILVHIRNDAGKCLDDLPFKDAMPLFQLGYWTDYYWNGVGPY